MLAIPFPNMDPVAFQVGPIAIRWYGLAYAVALIVGWIYARRLLARQRLWSGGKAPLAPEDIESLVGYIAAGVILGGRLGHVLFYMPSYYLSDPLKVFAVWEGGMSFHGGVVGTALAIILFAQRHNAPLWSVADLVCAAAPIGICLVRMANFVNGEVVGHVSDVPWAFVFPNWGEAPRHPAMLYEAALEGVVLFWALCFVIAKRSALHKPGLVSAYFLIGYAAARIFCELFKIVEFRLLLPPLPITTGMLLSLPMLLAGLWLLSQVRRGSTTAPN